MQRRMGDPWREVANIKAGAARAWLWQRLRPHHLRVLCAWLLDMKQCLFLFLLGGTKNRFLCMVSRLTMVAGGLPGSC